LNDSFRLAFDLWRASVFWEAGMILRRGRASVSFTEIELYAGKMVKIQCWTPSECYGMHFGPFRKNGSDGGVLSVATNKRTIEMKVTLNALLITMLAALNAAAQPSISPSPRPGPAMPPGLMKPSTSKEPAPQMPDKDTLSYFIGMSVGNSIKKQELTVDTDTIANAIKDVLSGKPTRFSDAQFTEIQRQLGGALRAKMMAQRQVEQAKMEKEGAENKTKGEAFLAKNATEPGIKTLTNGLQYKVITDGTGAMPAAHDTVTVSYKGSLIDGTVFDQNDKFTTPVTGRTIKGWSEVLQQMKVGSKWQVFIPPDLGYGMRGSPPKIAPNAVLIFDMELLSDTPAAGGPGLPPTASVASSTFPSPNVVSGQIIKVPSAEELKKGAKIEVITNVPAAGQ
jgi:FKBP-type peptidyl-prolyl cis-trans isomerase FklB